MHLAYLNQMRDEPISTERRKLLKGAGASILVGGMAPATAFSQGLPGFAGGSGRMGLATGEDWIDTFFTGGADAIINYYADEFVFEDITFFQAIDNKEELYRAFVPFNDAGPDSPAGVHEFNIVRYDGGLAGDRKGVQRSPKPAEFSSEKWQELTQECLMGIDYDYDEWAVMNWVWRAQHNTDDFLGIKGAKGKTTTTRGITFHNYKNRKIVREFTYWNFRDVAIQLGAMPKPNKFWEA